MERWARGTRVAVACAIAVVALAGLGAVVAASTGDAEQAAPASSAGAEARTNSKATSTTEAQVEVKGIVVTTTQPIPEPTTTAAPQAAPEPQPDPAPAAAPEPEPEPEPEPAPEPPPPPATCPSAGGGSLAEGILNGHRNIRCENGLPDVGLDPAMSANAQFHAERLMAGGACASLWHSSELSTWYGAGFWGENAACMDWSGGCWSDAGRVIDGWMASAEHRPNILNPNYHWIGIGIACDGRHTYMVVHFRS
jgi:uncharacterized protein YkwD